MGQLERQTALEIVGSRIVEQTCERQACVLEVRARVELEVSRDDAKYAGRHVHVVVARGSTPGADSGLLHGKGDARTPAAEVLHPGRHFPGRAEDGELVAQPREAAGRRQEL
jgi:hypothetical protein